MRCWAWPFFVDSSEAILLLQMIDRLCDSSGVDMPDEAVLLNVDLDDEFQTDVLHLRIER